MKSGVICHRNCCNTFARCDGKLFCRNSKSLPDNVDDIQAVRTSSTDQCKSSGQLLFSVDQWKRHQFIHSKKFRRLLSAFFEYRDGISNGTAALVKCHFLINWFSECAFLHPVFLSDVLNDVIGVTSNYSAAMAILPRLTTCVFSKAENWGRF